MKPPKATNAASHGHHAIAAATPIPTAAAIETTASPQRTRIGDPGRERPAAELVQRVRTDAEREREGGERRAEPARKPDRRDRRADDDVAQMPERVGDMEQRHVVAPAARAQGVPRSPRHDASTPDDDASAEAQAAVVDVFDAGRTPGLEQAVERPLAPEARDAAREKAADLGPARRDEPPGEWQAHADVRLPGGACEPDSRGRRTRGRRRAAGPHHSRELGERRGWDRRRSGGGT